MTRYHGDEVTQADGYGREANQVWASILDNAIDAMSGEGAIEESTQRTADHVAGELTDYGPVASAEAAVHICDQD